MSPASSPPPASIPPPQPDQTRPVRSKEPIRAGDEWSQDYGATWETVPLELVGATCGRYMVRRRRVDPEIIMRCSLVALAVAATIKFDSEKVQVKVRELMVMVGVPFEIARELDYQEPLDLFFKLVAYVENNCP